MLLIWNGGLGIFGAILAGGLLVLIYTRRNHLPLARYLDIAAPGLIIGQAIGRWGNFLNQELYGPPTELPWGITIDAPHRYGAYANLSAYPVDQTYFHPLFLYESVLNVIGFIVLTVIARRWRRVRDGDLILIYMIWYGLVRLIVESFRFDAWVVTGGLPAAQLISLIIMALGAGLLAVRHLRRSTVPIA
jgi:phosphatidylglycerol:prolipoprotein diacylglycerol transferase